MARRLDAFLGILARTHALPENGNLAEGKAVCILEAPAKQATADWFQKMGMPTESVTAVELEGERGTIKEA